MLADHHASGPPRIVEHQALGQGMVLDMQVRPCQCRVQVGEAAGTALAVAGVDVIEAGALEVGAVEVLAAGVAQLLAALDEGIADGMGLALHGADVDGTAGAVELGLAQRVALQLAEVGQHVLEGPAVVARCGPVVEVVGLAAHVDHRVDGARPTLHLAARSVDAAPGQLGLGLAVVHPVVDGVVVHLGEAHRHLEPGELSLPPASSSSTECWPEALRRLARMQPAEPAPMMMKSYVMSITASFRVRFGPGEGASPPACRPLGEGGIGQPLAGAVSRTSTGSGAICRCRRSPV